MSILEEIESYQVFFENIEVGARYKTGGRTLTEADIVAFAGLSGDYNALHTDSEYAAGTVHKQRIAHGLLVLSIVSGLSTRLLLMKSMERTILGLANLECRWKRPCFIGDTIHVELEVKHKSDSHKPDRGIVVLGRQAMNQRGETVMESDWKLVVKRKEPSAR